MPEAGSVTAPSTGEGGEQVTESVEGSIGLPALPLTKDHLLVAQLGW